MPIERAVYHSGAWVVFWTAPGGAPPSGYPVASFTYVQQKPTGTVNFDASASYESGGSIVKYAWDFGDNTPGQTLSTATTTHTYARSGSFSATLVVTDALGSTASITSPITVSISQQPVASFTTLVSGTSASVDASASVAGTGLSIASYAWDFGDGATASGVTAAHTYSKSGSYTITLVITDNVGSTNTVSHAVTVVAQMTADFTYSSSGLVVSVDGTPSISNNPITSYVWDFGLPVAVIATPVVAGASAAFDGSGSHVTGHSIASYAWNFGDGTTGTGVGPTHVYATGGNFTVTLVVTDDNGIASAPATVTVTATVDSFIYGSTKPSALNTGVGVVAAAPTSANTTPYTGDYTVSTSQTITGLHISGKLTINGGTVTVKNCIIDRHVDVNAGDLTLINCEIRINQLKAASTDTWGVYTNAQICSATVQFCTIHSTMSPMSIYVAGGVGAHNITVDRCNIYDVMDGIDTYNKWVATGPANIIAKGNYVHGLNYLSPEPRQSDNVTHCDGIQIAGGDGCEVYGNYFHSYAGSFSNAPLYANGTHPQSLSCVMLTPNTGPITSTAIHDNWLDGGEIMINGGALDRQGAASNGSVTNNRFGRDCYYSGAQLGFDATAVGKWTATGNVYEDNGTPITVHWNY